MLGRMIKLGPCFRWSRARYLCGFPRRLARRNPYSDHQPSNFGTLAAAVCCCIVFVSLLSAVDRVKDATTGSAKVVVSFDGLENSKTGQEDSPSPTVGCVRDSIEHTGASC